jgi:hypothetical protein
MVSAARSRALLACGIAGVCAAHVVGQPGPAAAQQNGSGKNPSTTVPAEVRELWREYPLNPSPPPAAPRQSRTDAGTTVQGPTEQGRTEQGPSAAAAEADPESLPLGLAVAIAVAVAALTLAAMALAFGLRPAWVPDLRSAKQVGQRPRRPRGRRTRTAPMRRRELYEVSAETPQPGAQDARGSGEPLPAEPKQDKLRLDSGEPGERSIAVKIVRSATQQEGDGDDSYAQVGEQVASVLAAARQAAEEIRTTALEEAGTIRDEASREAQQLRLASEALRTEAEEYDRKTREAADRYVEATRQQLEEETARRRGEIDLAAQESQRAAEERASAIEADALQRRSAIIEEAQRSEARLEQLLGVYRGMTSQLEELLIMERAGDDTVHAQEESFADELADDLRPQGSQAEAARRSGSPT